jgi:hypothetical protein
MHSADPDAVNAIIHLYAALPPEIVHKEMLVISATKVYVMRVSGSGRSCAATEINESPLYDSNRNFVC